MNLIIISLPALDSSPCFVIFRCAFNYFINGLLSRGEKNEYLCFMYVIYEYYALFIYFLIITYPCSYGLFDYDHCYLSFKFGELYS